MKIKNIAIIAHVDHGKTTLVNKLIESSIEDDHTKIADRAMDSNDIERERGITILAKNTSIIYKNTKINILDTPGHADFGGEVERIMHMVDGCLLVVDAFEGVMPQTRFVLQKALDKGVKPIVVINKIDRLNANPQKALNEVYDLFIDLGATLEQLDFKVLYGSAIIGKMSDSPDLEHNNGVSKLFDTIVSEIKDANGNLEKPFLFQPALIEYNSFVGRMGVGKIISGKVSVGDNLSCIRNDGEITNFRVQKIYQNIGLDKEEVKEAIAGDIVSIAGLSDVGVGETITKVGNLERLPKIDIGMPTVEIQFQTNTSPFAGLEGSFVTSTKLEERLFLEAEKDVSLKVEKDSSKDTWIVSGRGELHLSILIENMRREGYEFQVSNAKVVFIKEDGVLLEPYEEVQIDLPIETSGSVIEVLGQRGGELTGIENINNYSKINYIMPSRGLIGFMTQFLTLTKGYGIINHRFLEYRKTSKINATERKNGALISLNNGTSTEYALNRLEDRGLMFVEPRTKVYEGMIVGENNKSNDLVVNITQEKQLNNIRQANKDQTVVLKKAKIMNLEESLSFINDDELVEITPKSIRIRKRFLKEHERKKLSKV
ncbi:MAG TPA: translational GTPase TypA [Acholeplasmataceae bacterium]|nr:translational GTPase TypA [Acholeplasmataceae bacterium]